VKKFGSIPRLSRIYSVKVNMDKKVFEYSVKVNMDEKVFE
jgi:hypothetical protein